ncbi:3',5'-cyclic-nucleotide phosphodiesterase [Arcobacter sp. CECT 8986]|uniref:3',5'-cyclic-nucleotide phosphodiesterase n=1 Tax=Arcobacter sp. CECT 8986 TaxID=2044507 RepID=UPI001009C8C7|nr:3',5'-cyclic-nucleotide phosphodiesterase [Arcobacter sp. CECT 8986]RXK00515.1 3',5'-cyclic-nucleotide phosphodiesterase [Arcobacter sp. CECT 8986]
MFKDKIKILGAYGGKGIDANNTSIQIDRCSVIDAGNIIKAIGDDAKYIDNIFLTHSHLDHIVDIPFLIESFYEIRNKPIKIYALKETIDHLNRYIFNWNIWPDFTDIDLINQKHSIEFVEIQVNKVLQFKNFSIKPIKTNHTISSCGYVITKEENSIFFTADTFICDEIWEELNQNLSIKQLIVDVSFPSRLEVAAQTSKHLTLKLLKEELKKLKRDDIKIYINHLKPTYIEEITEELKVLGLDEKITILNDSDVINLKKLKRTSRKKDLDIEQLIMKCSTKDDFDRVIKRLEKEKQKIR